MPSASISPRPSAEERLVASLIELMERGSSPWRRDWLISGGGHHVNLLSGRRYRGANPALLHLGQQLRGSSLPYWCGFVEARSRGLFPRRGSQAVLVLRPQVLGAAGDGGEGQAPGTAAPEARPGEGSGAVGPHGRGRRATGQRSNSAATATTAAAPSAAPGNGSAEAAAGERPRRVRYRPVPLFNAADLQGEGLAELIAARQASHRLQLRPEPERLRQAELVLRRWPVPMQHGGDRACYFPAQDRILLPERRAFLSAPALYATWAHEAIHSTGHATRLNRDLSGVMAAPGPSGQAYAREELVAELGAVLLGDRLEIGSDGANHAAYLRDWIALLRETPRLLFQLLSEARRAADLICPEGDPEALPEDRPPGDQVA